MDSEHRHELHTNDLSRVAVVTKTWLEENIQKVAIAVVIATVVLIGLFYTYQSAQEESARAWTMLNNSRSEEDYAACAEKFPKSTAGQIARLREAELYLDSGLKASFEDSAAAKVDLDRALEGFEKLLKSTSLPATVRERGLFGLARCQEGLCNGDTTVPQKTYEQLLNQFPETYLKALAQARIDALKKEDTAAFYKWFYAQNITKEDKVKPPRDGLLPGLEFPPSPDTPKDSSDSKAKENNPADKPAENSSSDKKPSDDSKEEKKPTDEKDSSNKPAEKDAETTKSPTDTKKP